MKRRYRRIKAHLFEYGNFGEHKKFWTFAVLMLVVVPLFIIFIAGTDSKVNNQGANILAESIHEAQVKNEAEDKAAEVAEAAQKQAEEANMTTEEKAKKDACDGIAAGC